MQRGSKSRQLKAASAQLRARVPHQFDQLGVGEAADLGGAPREGERLAAGKAFFSQLGRGPS